MTQNSQKTGQVKIIKASNALQIKAGTGKIEASRIRKAEQVIEANTEDFVPMAEGFLQRLENAIRAARIGEEQETELLSGMTKPIMELKANAQMFKYDLVSILANVMLGFLEHIRTLDKDVTDLVEAHRRTLNLILSKRMKGDNGHTGTLLKAELEEAIQRYFIKRAREKAKT